MILCAFGRAAWDDCSAVWMHRKINRGDAKCARVCGVVEVDLCMWWTFCTVSVNVAMFRYSDTVLLAAS